MARRESHRLKSRHRTNRTRVECEVRDVAPSDALSALPPKADIVFGQDGNIRATTVDCRNMVTRSGVSGLLCPQ